MEVGRPARRGDPSPAPTYGAVQAPWSSETSPPSRGAARTRISVAPGSHRQDVRGNSSHGRTRGDDRGCSGPSARRGARRGPLSLREWPCTSPSRSQVSAHVARREVVSGRSIFAARRGSGGVRRKSDELRRRTQRPGESRLLRPVARAGGSREPARSRNAIQRARDATVCREAHPVRRRRSTWFSRVGRPQGHDHRRVPDDGPARGKGSELEPYGSCPRVVERLQNPASKVSCSPRSASKAGS